MTEDGAWASWILYVLDAVESTSGRTLERNNDILGLLEAARVRVQIEAPRIYSKGLIDQVLLHPYCRIQFHKRAGLGTRQTCGKHLRGLEYLGILSARRVGREVCFINGPLFELPTR